MTKKIVTMALAAALAATTVLPTVADAGPRRGRNFDNHGNHHVHNGGHRGHRGRGHYRNGKWIALGILGAAAAAAVANSDDVGCYRRNGRRYCN